MLVILLLRSITYIFFLYCYFSAIMPPSVVAGEDSRIPVLEDITDEEAEAASASGSKETTPKEAKLKVPRK